VKNVGQGREHQLSTINIENIDRKIKIVIIIIIMIIGQKRVMKYSIER
jgi:hypothetical protein